MTENMYEIPQATPQIRNFLPIQPYLMAPIPPSFYPTLRKINTSIRQLQLLQTGIITFIAAQLPLFSTLTLPNLETFYVVVPPTLFRQFLTALIAGAFYILAILFSLLTSATTTVWGFGAIPVLLAPTLAFATSIVEVGIAPLPKVPHFIALTLVLMSPANKRDNKAIVACSTRGGRGSQRGQGSQGGWVTQGGRNRSMSTPIPTRSTENN